MLTFIYKYIAQIRYLKSEIIILRSIIYKMLSDYPEKEFFFSSYSTDEFEISANKLIETPDPRRGGIILSHLKEDTK